jgi:hypothetical protein
MSQFPAAVANDNTIIAARETRSGGIVVQRKCRSCQHAFWSGYNDHKHECTDCDPNTPIACGAGVGRGHDRKFSDHQFHGSNYAG